MKESARFCIWAGTILVICTSQGMSGWRAAFWKGIKGFCLMATEHESAVYPGSQKGPRYHGVYQDPHCQSVEGRGCPTLLCAVSSLELCEVLGATVQERHKIIWEHPKEGYEVAEVFTGEDRLGVAEVTLSFNLWKLKLLWDIMPAYCFLMKGSRGTDVFGDWWQIWNCLREGSDWVLEKGSSLRVIGHWNRSWHQACWSIKSA